jgi:hypothetical protein
MRIEMYKKVTKLLGAIALTGWMGVANATLIFDFSWGGLGSETMGEIRGLELVIGEQSATSIILTRISGKEENIEVIVGNSSVILNNFTVINMEINTAQFEAFLAGIDTKDSIIQFGRLHLYSPGEISEASAQIANDFVVGIGAVSYNKREVLVPEPGTVILLSLGLVGLSFARYRRQS